ncbi:uncharacterized protein LY89DRAFT_690082, partial [Mollisia scopiformis]
MSSNNPYKLHDVEANHPLPPPSPIPSPNPFLDQAPNVPPPAYNFHAEAENLLLPPNTSVSRSASPSPFKRQESPSAAYYRKQQYNKRRFICFLVAIIIMIAIALVVAGVAFKWGRNNVCIRWDDGSTSGNCD